MKPMTSSPRFVRQTQENTKKKAFKNAQRRAAESLGIHNKAHGPIPTIELFQKESCPFSHAVRNKLTQLGLDFVAHNVPADQPRKHEQLIQAGGKDQVPFLIDHSSGVKLYESQAILAYLDKAYGEPAKNVFGLLAKGLDRRIRSRADEIAWVLRAPILRARDLQLDMRNAINTLESSIDFLRDRIEAAVSSRGKARPAQKSAAQKPAPRKGPRATTGVRVDIASMTEAA
jgi:glutathione S-transferase